MSTREFVPITEYVDIRDDLRKPINSDERNRRISGKSAEELYPYYGATGQVGWIDSYLTDGEYVLVGEDGAPFLDPFKEKAYIISGKTWVNNHAHILKAKDGRSFNQFIRYYLNSFNFESYVNGTTRLKLTKGSLEKIPVPFFSIEQQKKITSKLDQLFAEIDQGAEQLRVTEKNLETFKQSVLNAAIQGKLVPQDPNDEPASKLLQRIRAEKEKLIQAGKLKKEKPLPPIDPSEVPFELPNGWEWVRLQTLSELVTDGDHNPPKRSEKGIPYLTSKHVKKWQISTDRCSFISEQDFAIQGKRYTPKEGDLILTCVGTVGESAIVPPGLVFSADRNLAAIRFREKEITRWVHLAINAPSVLEELKNASGATAQPHIYLGDIRKQAIPLPPGPEQSKIVIRVDQLISEINNLSEEIAKKRASSDLLKQSILKSAFEGRLL